MSASKKNNKVPNAPQKSGDSKNVWEKKDKASPLTLPNILLLAFLMLGIGCLFGYFQFVSLYETRCSEVERKFAQDRQQLQDRYLQSVGEYQSCISELNNCDGPKNSIRFEKYQVLMDRHQDTVDQLLKMQSNHADSLVSIQDLETELDITQIQVKKLQSDKRKCQASKDLLRTMVEECKDNGEL
jgi:hypothetical protein